MGDNRWTCVCCEVRFTNGGAQREHHSSEWHRYNLVRRVNSLPPVSYDHFLERSAANKPSGAPGAPATFTCRPCNKTFTSNNSYTNHVNSKKHKLAEEWFFEEESHTPAEKDVAPVDDVEDDDDDWSSFEEINDIFPNDCLFCTHHSKTVTKNLAHMAVVHSFFVPDAEYCVDLKGFLTYLGEKVSQGFMCLWCNDKGKAFQSLEAAQAHMRDKGHCKALHEGSVLAEYADFYDYSSSYPDHVEGDEDMEVDPEDSSVQIMADEGGEEYQLVLPSGAVIGHRSLLRYYKQNLTSHTGALVKKNDEKLKRVINQYKMLGWSPQQNDVIAKKAKDIKYMRKVQTKWNMQLGVKANKLQKHFRVQCNF